jgi:PAS domain S-box-containing protein
MFTKRATQVPYNVSSPYLEDHIVLVTTIEKPFVKDLSNNLDKVYVIEKAQKGIVNIVKKKYPDIRLKYVDTIEKAYQMVLDQEVYGYIGKSLSTMHIIQKNYSSTLKIMTQLFKMNLGVGVNEDEPELLNIINKVLQTIDEQTKIQIRNNWSSTTIETKVDYTYLWYLLLAMFVIVSLVVYRQIILNRSNALLEKTNKKLLDQKKEFETIFSSSKDGIAIVDLESHFLNCNKAYCEMLGYTKEELLTMSCIGLTLPEERQNAILALEEILTVGYKTNFEKLCLRKDDTIVTVNMTGSIYPDKKRILLISKDISSNKLLEEQSKLASMGEMIGNIAHQWRQPLSVITTASTGALYQKEIGTLTDEFFEKEMNNINDQAQYLSRTIDDFRNFIKGDQEEVEIKINEAIEYAIHLTEATLKNNYINTVIDLDDDMEIHGSKNELIQSFINIINNSKDALKEKCEEEDRYIFISSSKKSENSLEIKICDTGGGIPDDVIERIFEPYFTTKHQNVGTGIGLSMVNKILRDKYHAQIQVNNQHTNYKDKEYYGACFKILFHRN